MRESPWHQRIPTLVHFQWFKNLLDIHEMTTAWLEGIQTERSSHELTRGLSAEALGQYEILASVSKIPLEVLLNETTPVDLLMRLEHKIWAVQSWTLTHIYEKLDPQDQSALDSLLEQTAWSLGRKCSTTRWSKRSLQCLSDALLALNDSPLMGYPHGDGFLIRRAVSTQIDIELRHCPHQIQYQEVKLVPDRLCQLHAQWIRGFAYALNPSIKIDHRIESPRCIQTWTFI